MKKIVSAILAVIFIAAFSLCTVSAGAVGATTGEVDVIFLVDSSMSMHKSDPDNIRLEAIKLFSDLCALGSTNVGFVLFGSGINYSQPPISVDSEEDRRLLKETVDGLTETHGSTDIGKAVKYAVEVLAGDGYSGKGKFIVFLSDGKTVITGTKGERTLEDSQKDLEDGILMAQEAGIPIYTIGLNANGDVDQQELQHISEATYADDTYMTENADDLSAILSDIYVRHTGAENTSAGSFISDGSFRDVPFSIPDSTVVEANIVIMRSGGLDELLLKNADGSSVSLESADVSVFRNDNYTLIKLYSPQPGDRVLSIRSPQETSVSVNCILSRDFSLDLSLLTDKAVGNGTLLKLNAVLRDMNGAVVTDEALIGRLSCKITVRDRETDETRDMLLKYDNGAYTGEYTLQTGNSCNVQASAYSDNIDIRSEIIVLEAGSERFKEPEGPLKMILICAGSGIAFIVIVVLIARKVGENIRMWSGRLTVSGNTGGMPTPPAVFDFAKKVPGKRKITLFEVLSGAFDEQRADNLIPRNISSAVQITMSRSGDIRISHSKGLDYSGGLVKGKNTLISTGGRATMKYADKAAGMSNIVVIQYMRT